MKINLVYLSPWPVGGFASFTGHFARALKDRGWEFEVLRCNRDKAERSVRHSAADFDYRNATVAEVCQLARREPTLVTAVARPEDFAVPDTMRRLIRAGAYVFVQSTQEFRQFPHVDLLKKDSSRTLVIRESLLRHFPKARYVPHPYVRVGPMPEVRRTGRACSLAMVAKNKKPDVLLEGSMRVSKKDRIRLLGRLTTHFLGMDLEKKYPKVYERPKGYKTSAEAVALAAKYELAVDLSAYDGDGGGTQYCFLEAADAGAVNVLHRDWTKVRGDMKQNENCVVVGDVEELVNVLKTRELHPGEPFFERLGVGGAALLDAHGPKKFCARLAKVLR